MRQHDLLKLQLEHAEWLRHNFPDYTPQQALMGMVEELGEIAHAQLKLEQNIRGDAATHREELIDGVADLVIFLCGFCTLHDISLAAAVKEVWAEVSQRDWIKFPKNGRTE